MNNDKPIRLKVAAGLIGIDVQTLRKYHIDSSRDFDKNLLNVTRTSARGYFVVKPTEVERYVEESSKV